jgi:arylsulfatase
MVERWWEEAESHNVLPVDNRPFSAFVFERPPTIPERSQYVYRPGAAAVPEAVAVNVRNRSHTINADVVVPEGGAEGVLIAQGSLLGGWALYLQEGRLRYLHTLSGWEEHRVVASDPVPAGAHTLTFRFTKTGEHQGTGTLLVDGAVVGEAAIPRFTPTRFSLHGAGLTCGYDGGLAVTDDYPAPFPFRGELRRVVVDVDGEPYIDAEGEAEIAIATQ